MFWIIIAIMFLILVVIIFFGKGVLATFVKIGTAALAAVALAKAMKPYISSSAATFRQPLM